MATKKVDVLARLLVRHEPRVGVVFEANTLLKLTEAQAETFKAAGLVDTSEAAVKYCADELKAEPVSFDGEPNDDTTAS